MDTYTRTTYISRVTWLLLFVVVIVYEMFTLPKGHKDTLSDAVWYNIRFTNWMYLFLPLQTWIIWHWWLRTEKTIDYRDGIAIFLGVLWAIADHYFLRSR